jgi:hypothetical protein
MTDTYGGSHGGSADYPATFTFDPPDHIANWRPLVHWLLAIPHFVVVYALGIVSEVVAVISWFAIVITGELPAGLANFQALYLRYYLRTATFAGFVREEYPPFTFATTPADPADDPRISVNVVPQLTDRNRLTTGFRFILVIPQFIVVALLGIALWVVGLIGFFAVLFTGRWPAGLRDFALGVGRWWLRVQAYWLLLTDEYPPFATDDLGTAPQPVSPPPAPA